MSKEFFAANVGVGINCYTVLSHDTDMQFWNGTTFEPLTPANWASYVLSPALTNALGDYAGDMPTAITTPMGAIYSVFQRRGTIPAFGDQRAATGTFNWDGTAKVDVNTSNATQLRRNKPFTAFPVLFYSSTDHLTPRTGLTGIAAQRSLDGGAFASCANAFTEVGSGLYKIDLAAADTNASSVTYRFIASGADPVILTLYPSP